MRDRRCAARERSGRVPGILLISAASLLACDPVERRADAIEAMRQDAVRGIDALEAFCQVRDSVAALAERGEIGAERVFEEVLAAPAVVHDYCVEFRYHSHDEPAAHDTGTAGPDTSR